MIDISSNQPLSEDQPQQFPKEAFPIHIHLIFAKRYSYLVNEMKEILKELPKETHRFRKKTNPYAGVGVHLYLKDADSLRPLIPWLKQKALYQDKGLDGDERLFPHQIMDKAKVAIEEVKGRAIA